MAKRRKISVCCQPMTREFETNSRKGRVMIREIVYMHGVLEIAGRRWFRGARVS